MRTPLEGSPLRFDPGRVDLSGMNGRQGDLHIDDVYHKAFIAVDEEGTEAAAATSITIIKTNASFSSVEVHFDRPFLFVV